MRWGSYGYIIALWVVLWYRLTKERGFDTKKSESIAKGSRSFSSPCGDIFNKWASRLAQSQLNMKKNIAVKVCACLALLVSITLIPQLSARPIIINASPHVLWYSFPASGPNDRVIPTFPTWRDAFVNAIVLNAGQTITPFTSSRSNNPAAIEIKNVFEMGDAAVISGNDVTDYLWRGLWNPTNPHYTNQLGSHIYCPILVVGNGVKIQLSGLSYNVQDAGNVLNNSSSLVTNSYSVSRVGIIVGPSGKIFGNDATIVKTGTGTNLVDAIFFIGARAGAWVTEAGLTDFNNYIPTNGDKISFVYSYQWTTNGVPKMQNYEKDVMLYRQGQIPVSYYGMEYFTTPIGMLFSLVEPETNTYTMWTSRQVNGSWFQQSTTATTAWSFEWPFTYNPTNDTGFVKFQQNIP